MIFLINLYSKEIIITFLNERYYPAIKLIPFLSIGYIFTTFQTTINLSLYQDKKTYITTILYFISAVINVASLLFLLPKFGLIGVAISLILAHIFYAVIGYYVSTKYYFIPYKWGEIIKIAILLLFISGFIYSVQTNNIIFDMYIKLFMTLFIGIYFYYRYYNEIKQFYYKSILQ